ncbi:MAG: helix-turn-helix transcriptional regulator [Chloroflexi bacterium]|nr:helix-turn-helix transcriptional regulator [Chloroflexota bacterium]
MAQPHLTPVKKLHPIKEACRARGITQKQAAARVGLHEQTLSGWVSGKTEINYNNYKLYDLLRFLKLSLNALNGVGGNSYDR